MGSAPYLLDRREEMSGRDATHALIVGVSAYRRLPPHNAQSTDSMFGLRGLSSSALSAYRVAEWLIRRQERLAAPLATLRLMITPSDRELEAEPKLAELASECGINDFLQAANEWRLLAQKSRASLMFFYFAGLAKDLARSERVLLMGDFGDPMAPVLRSAVSVNNLLYGLSPTQRQPDIARTQLFFIDSSLTELHELMSYELVNPTRVFDAEVLGLDDRCAPVFYTSQPGGQAYGIKGQQSFFSSALLECLDGAAAVPATGAAGDDAESESLAWYVTVSSLIEGLNTVLQQRRRKMQEQYPSLAAKPEYAVGGVVRDAVIHRLDRPPAVPVVFRLESQAAVDDPVVINISDDPGNPVASHIANFDRHPTYAFELTLVAGYYRVSVERGDKRLLSRIRLITPPFAEWKVKV